MVRETKKAVKKDRLFDRLRLECVHQSCPDRPGVRRLAVYTCPVHIDIQGIPGNEISGTDNKLEVVVNLELIDQIKFPTDACIIPQQSSYTFILHSVTKGITVCGGVTNIKSLEGKFVPGR